MNSEHNRTNPEAMSIHRSLTELVRTNTLEPVLGGRARMLASVKPVLSVNFPDNPQREVTLTANRYPKIDEGESHPRGVEYLISDSEQQPDIQVSEGDITASVESPDQVSLVKRMKTLLDDIRKPTTTITPDFLVEGQYGVIQIMDEEGRLHVDVPRLRLL